MSDWSLSVRVRNNNPDHHLFNNHGTWWCHFWAIADGIRQQRFRVNLLREGWQAHIETKLKGGVHV